MDPSWDAEAEGAIQRYRHVSRSKEPPPRLLLLALRIEFCVWQCRCRLRFRAGYSKLYRWLEAAVVGELESPNRGHASWWPSPISHLPSPVKHHRGDHFVVTGGRDGTGRDECMYIWDMTSSRLLHSFPSTLTRVVLCGPWLAAVLT